MGIVSGITKATVGLPNADNTSDANKPVITATDTAITTAINNLVSAAPEELNILNELATALGNDAIFQQRSPIR